LAAKEITEYAKEFRQLRRETKQVWKFSEEIWRGLTFGLIMVYGFKYCTQSSYFLSDWWNGWPYQVVEPHTNTLLMLEFGSYLHQTIFHFSETKRKDFLEMLIHHTFAMLLCVFSSILNLTRIAPLTIMVFEINTTWVSLAKIFVYLGPEYSFFKHLSDVMFLAFVLSYHFLHFYIVPIYINRPVFMESPTILQNTRSYWIFSSCFVVLFCLHLYWAAMIWKMLYKQIVTGELKDVRSDDEEEEEEKESSEENKDGKKVKAL